MSSVIVNFGSINIDYVYHVSHFVKPGETLLSQCLSKGLGGKGANQSAAIARAGVRVVHIGRVSQSDRWAVEMLAATGVDTQHIEFVESASGHAIIQVDGQGENAIVLYGGANQSFSRSTLESAFDSIAYSVGPVEYLLMQNECNHLAEAIDIARARGIKIVLNPAPMTSDIKALPLQHLDTLIVNQGEAEALCGANHLNEIIEKLGELVRGARVVITLGGEGAVMFSKGVITRVKAPQVEVVDTTAAGDTFVGYFLASLIQGFDEKLSAQIACRAASTAATRKGAIASIPAVSEIGV